MKLLIDTDELIEVDEDEQLEQQVATVQHLCARHGLEVFVLEAARQHALSGGAASRETLASRLEGLPSLPDASIPSRDELEEKFGSCASDDDALDAALLNAAAAKLCDFIVSDDSNLHRRAQAAGLEARVFTIEDALAWISKTYEPKDVPLPTVSDIFADELDFSDSIFDELRSDYQPGFDDWSAKISDERRDCWIVGVEDRIAALVIRKDETHEEAKTKHLGPKILKISTFKVSEDFRGRKLGEHLVKQILWFAQRNSYDLVYLTAYPKQKALQMLLQAYGFDVTASLENGEKVLEKIVAKGPLMPQAERHETAFAATCRGYPNFVCTPDVAKFVIPIQPNYHAMLFPEWGRTAEEAGVEILGRPGNTIEKVYLCHSQIRSMRSGDVVLFYRSKRTGDPGSQSITTVGVVKSVRWTQDIDEVRLWTAKRSVYPDTELVEMAGRTTPLMIIDFLLVGHLETAVSIDVLTAEGILRGPPQSVVRISEEAFAKLKEMMDLGFAF